MPAFLINYKDSIKHMRAMLLEIADKEPREFDLERRIDLDYDGVLVETFVFRVGVKVGSLKEGERFHDALRRLADGGA